MASLRPSLDSSLISLPSSSRKFINDIPPDKRSKLCTEIDYTIHRNEGYWQKLISRLGFDETHSKKFRLSFEMHGSPTDNLLRDCSYRMLRIRHLHNVLIEIGLPNLAEAYLKDYDTEEPLPPLPIPFINGNLTRSTLPFDPLSSGDSLKAPKGARWPGIDTFHFSFEEIKEGTNNFSHKMELGAGAFGKVYKVFLNKTLFACKVLKIDKENQLTTSLLETHRQHDDLRNELNYLAEYRHPNVIALYGWSLDGPDPCLIYDYMKNGSLQDRLQCLNGSRPMSWEIRIKVSCGAARGLQFLHTKNAKPLIHGDIKTANILLDNSFTAKLGDFGLAREMPHNAATGSYIRLGNEHTPGTLGYLANEYIVTKKLSVQVDTYAFGVVLLELYTGRRAYDRSKETPLLRDFMDEVANDAAKSTHPRAYESLLRLQDPGITNLMDGAALRYVRLALACCHEKRRERPKMADTLAELNEIERKVAFAYGREPEESLPLSVEGGAGQQVSVSDEVEKSAMLKRMWLLQRNGKASDGESDQPNPSRNPVESVDHSIIKGEKLLGKMESRKPNTCVEQAASALAKLTMNEVSSSDDSDSQGRSSAETTNCGQYYVHRADPYPHLFPSGQLNSQPMVSYYPSSNPSGYSSSVPSHQFVSHGYAGSMNKVRMGEGQVSDMLYAPNPMCVASRGVTENPFNLDLSKVPRTPCYCSTCTQVQPQNVSPMQSQVQWPGQVDPETFTSYDYKAASSYPKYGSFYPSKVSTNGDVSPNDFLPSQPGPSSNLRDLALDSSLSSIAPTQPNSFCFHRSSAYGMSDCDDPDDLSSVPLPLSINPVKESLLDKLKDGQSYTQIFPDKTAIEYSTKDDD